jgi:hypothetical protein
MSTKFLLENVRDDLPDDWRRLEVDLKEMGCEGVNSILVVQDRDYWWARRYVTSSSVKAGYFLNSWTLSGFQNGLCSAQVVRVGNNGNLGPVLQCVHWWSAYAVQKDTQVNFQNFNWKLSSSEVTCQFFKTCCLIKNKDSICFSRSGTPVVSPLMRN